MVQNMFVRSEIILKKGHRHQALLNEVCTLVALLKFCENVKDGLQAQRVMLPNLDFVEPVGGVDLTIFAHVAKGLILREVAVEFTNDLPSLVLAWVERRNKLFELLDHYIALVHYVKFARSLEVQLPLCAEVHNQHLGRFLCLLPQNPHQATTDRTRGVHSGSQVVGFEFVVGCSARSELNLLVRHLLFIQLESKRALE